MGKAAGINKDQIGLALSFAGAGIVVHPVSEHTKRPKTAHGHLDATADEKMIRLWWSQWPESLVAMPTGPRSGYVVLDVDGEAGQASLGQLLTVLGATRPNDVTPLVVTTPSGGAHLYFSFETGTSPRSRASDIAAGLDSRGAGGAIILPGNWLPNGKRYRLASTAQQSWPMILPPELLPVVPRKLLFLMTFGISQRAIIKRDRRLQENIAEAAPSEWEAVFNSYRPSRPPTSVARYVAGDLRGVALSHLAEVTTDFSHVVDGRRVKLFQHACHLGKYVHHEAITWQEFRTAFLRATELNGALQKYGHGFVDKTLDRGLQFSKSDPLPAHRAWKRVTQ